MGSYSLYPLSSFIVLGTLMGTINSFASAQNVQAKISLFKAITQNKEIFGLIGSPASVACNSGNQQALRSCRWERLQDPNAGKFQITFNAHSILNDTDPLYRYTGVGLEKGDCTMSISNITQFHGAKWECLLFSASENYTWIGGVEIRVFDAVTKPFVFVGERKNSVILNGTNQQKDTVRCCVDGGYPNMSFKFQTSIFRESIMHLPSYNTSKSTKATKKCAVVEYSFLPVDNGKSLVCNVTYNVDLQKFTVSNQTLLEVYFGPQLGESEPEELVQKIDNGKNATFTIPVMAHPRPNAKLVMKANDNQTAYSEVEKNTNYTIELKHIRDDVYWCKLTILNVTKDHYADSRFQIVIYNKFVTQEVPLQIKIVSPEPGKESEAFWLMIFIAVGAAVLLLIFGIVMYLLYGKTKRTGRYDTARVRYTAPATQIEEQ